MPESSSKILITGACGQLGSELTTELRKIHGEKSVIASDIVEPNRQVCGGLFERLDVLDRNRLNEVVDNYDIKIVYHLAALLSAKAEKDIAFGWKLNVEGLLNVLNCAKDKCP
jgi:nucleoside-diphosphate-sugar epimerase